ncbi:class III lanthipeptide [Kitasatospora sp. NPDC058063]
MTDMANILALQELDEEIVVDAPFSSISAFSC